ncbi:perlucin-like protein [Contarinia nasturtii]|uniref:perlucin-like protein n=1 Tax=Contarinia nasturtii TaxID=265458 RepID=UPI0012D44839|nr:perlucin-like protein [Contarinia nasturtii]XP_031632769.1 perlucin-like protein [Contarinia nasturtii]XP_031632770.1 perlucin-like protein [Contarinia nasturtii]
MKLHLVFTIILLLIVPIFGQLYSPKHKITKKFFLMTLAPANWYRAFFHCRSLGMNLASISSREENNQILKQIRDEGHGSKDFWISAMDLLDGNDFFWMGNGKSVTFADWAPGQPSNSLIRGERESCVHIFNTAKDASSVSKWNDRVCSDKIFFICEQEITEYEYCTN